MLVLADILVGLVALLHFYFLVLEMFFWTRPLGLRVFRQSLERAEVSSVLAANQGLYNGFLAAGLVWGLLHSSPEIGLQIKLFFLSCVILAGLYGAYSVSRRIFWIQSFPAVLGWALIYFGS